jgi:hypothetical protein
MPQIVETKTAQPGGITQCAPSSVPLGGSPLERGLCRSGGIDVNKNARECVHRLDRPVSLITMAPASRAGVYEIPKRSDSAVMSRICSE